MREKERRVKGRALKDNVSERDKFLTSKEETETVSDGETSRRVRDSISVCERHTTSERVRQPVRYRLPYRTVRETTSERGNQ
mgnify:CR=1 FL=1